MGKEIQTNFKRIETKYILSKHLYSQMKKELMEHMVADEYANSTIGNIYYDTVDDLMIRTSLEKPNFKEKLRLRTYDAVPHADSTAFIEIKRKHDKVVYKRRLTTQLSKAMAYLNEGSDVLEDSQIKREVDWVNRRYHHLVPKMYIYYDRYSMKGKEESGVRLTIDYNLRYRTTNLALDQGTDGLDLLPKDQVIMEIKVPGAYPIWLSNLLSQYEIYPSSFSKYGTAYLLTKQGGNTYEHLAI